MAPDDQNILLEKQPDYQSQINAREKIVSILTNVETRQAYSDKLLEKELRDLEDHDQRFCTEVVNGVLRWRGKLDWYLNQLYLGEFDHLLIEVKNNLRSSVYQLIFLDKVPPYAVLFEAVEIAKVKYNQKTANLVNAILRNFLRQRKKYELLESQLEVLDRYAIKFSHPKWMIQRWIEYWGIDEVSQLCQYNNKRPRLSVRLNHKLASPDIFFSTLEEKGISFEIHPDFPNFVWIDDFQEFRKTEFLSKGWVSVQDISTGLPVLLLDPNPGELILDMCTAPGGKSGFIAERLQNQGLLLGFDRHISRVRLTRENLNRLDFKNCFLVVADSIDLPTSARFNRILVDAPCSGLGVLSKRVDLRWKRTEQDIVNMKKLQIDLVESASKNLEVGGILVYSTCTIEPEENEGVIDTFLKNNKAFELESLKGMVPDKYLGSNYFIRTFPHKHQMDGSFAARLKKIR